MPRPIGSDVIYVLKPTVVTDPTDNSTIEHFNPPASRTAVRRCDVQPFLLAEKLQFELTGERTYTRSTMRVFAPTDATTLGIQPEDRVEYKGTQYEVFGHIGDWTDLNGRPDHIAFIIMLRQG